MRTNLPQPPSTWVSLPSPPLRRICRRQSPTSYASTHVTSPLCKAENTTRYGYLCQERVTPNARHTRGLRPQPEITAGGFATAEAPASRAHRKRTANKGTTRTFTMPPGAARTYAFRRADHPRRFGRGKLPGEGMRCRTLAGKGTRALPRRREPHAHWRHRRQIARRRPAPKGS